MSFSLLVGRTPRSCANRRAAGPNRPALPRVAARRRDAARDAFGAGEGRAAAALAGAFNEDYATSITTPSSGQPSRAASQPLSLDDVFRGQKATVEQRRHGDNVSFDEFFSPRDSGNVPAIRNGGGDREAEQPGGRPQEADLALFHDWLDGLKK